MTATIPFNVELDQGDAPTLVLLHGFMGCLRDWDALRTKLRPRWRTLAIDLPGHGHTPLASFDRDTAFARLPTALITLLDELALSGVHLLGYSMGGRVALALALHAPHRFASLILESINPGLETKAERAARQNDEQAWAAQLRSDPRRFQDDWQARPLFARQQERNPRGYREVRDQRAKGDLAGWAGALLGYGLGRQPDYWPRLPSLNLPVLLVTGEEDGKFANLARRMAGLLPQATHSTIPRAAHTPHLEQPADFHQTVAAFLAAQAL